MVGATRKICANEFAVDCNSSHCEFTNDFTWRSFNKQFKIRRVLAAQVAARAISLADIPDESAQQIAISTVEQTVNLNDVEVAVELDSRIAKVDLRFSREVAVPIIGRLFKRVELRASAVMPRQLATN